MPIARYRSAVLCLLACGLSAQNFTAQLMANLPMQVSFNGIQSHPAGPLGSNGDITNTFSIGTTLSASLTWSVPTASDLSCTTTTTLDTGSLTGSWWPATFQSDTTLSISGPTGRWGSVEIEMTSTNNPLPTVDVGDDGSIETTIGPFYGSVGSGSQTRRWSVPVQLTQLPLPIRIVHPSNQRTSSFYQSVDVRFVPWSANAVDLGTGCSHNHTGWITGKNRNVSYALSVKPGSGGAAAMLHAQGYGPLQVFVLASQPSRLPVATIPFGVGCDDVLSNVITTASGQPPFPMVDTEWTLAIPPLAPGLTFFLQHVSFSPTLSSTAPAGYFGATNAVRYQT